MVRLNGKIALITGAASGQGEAIAKLFAKEEAIVIVSDISTTGEKVTEEIINAGGKAFFKQMDVSNQDDWQETISFINSRFNVLDILVNNAGIPTPYANQMDEDERWHKMMDVNAKSVHIGMKSAIELMKKSKAGASIINNSSMFGLVGGGSSPEYQASKGAVTLLTKHAAIKYAKDNIRVNSIHPGIILTPMVERSIKIGRGDMLIENTPLNRIGKPEEVAYAALFLASNESSYITGVSLPIDGGYTAK